METDGPTIKRGIWEVSPHDSDSPRTTPPPEISILLYYVVVASSRTSSSRSTPLLGVPQTSPSHARIEVLAVGFEIEKKTMAAMKKETFFHAPHIDSESCLDFESRRIFHQSTNQYDEDAVGGSSCLVISALLFVRWSRLLFILCCRSRFARPRTAVGMLVGKLMVVFSRTGPFQVSHQRVNGVCSMVLRRVHPVR